VFASPALSGNGEVYFGTRSQELFALDSFDGSFLWSFVKTDWIDSPPVLLSSGEVLTVSRDGILTCLSPTGFELWARDVGEVLYSAPAVDAFDRIYIAGYVGSGQTRFSCLSSDGSLLSETTLTGINDSSPNIGNDGRIYFGMYSNELIAFEGNGEPLSYTSIWPRFCQNLHQNGRYTGFDPIVTNHFPTAIVIAPDWYEIDWYGEGVFHAGNFPWIYHLEHEWVYCSDPGGSETYWFYDAKLGWMYTAPDWADVFFSESADAWVFYLKGTSLSATGGRWFFNFVSNLWLQELSLLPSL
jgi:hypothetical protein